MGRARYDSLVVSLDLSVEASIIEVIFGQNIARFFTLIHWFRINISMVSASNYKLQR